MQKHDFEGITYNNITDEIYVIIEGRDDIFVLDTELIPKANSIIKIDREDSNGKTVLVKDKENGLEGITIYNNTIYVANQSFNKWPQEDPSVILKLFLNDSTHASIDDVIPSEYVNISGMCVLGNTLYIVSDTDNELITYDMTNRKFGSAVRLNKKFPLLKGSGLEGIAIDNNGFLYLADDTKGKIYKFNLNH